MNNQPKHTPGPWKTRTFTNISKNVDLIAVVAEIGNSLIVEPTFAIGSKEEANANLIAAAPEMYELLSEINTAFYTRTSRKEWLSLMEKSKPLLQKARGEGQS